MNHFDLKIWPQFFEQVEQGYKRFEVRKLDRLEMFAKGDTITLREFDPEKKRYTGREISGVITCTTILSDVPGFEMPVSANHIYMVFGFDVGEKNAERLPKISGVAAERWKDFFAACCAALATDSNLTPEAAVKMGSKCADLMQAEFEKRFDYGA